MMPDGPTGLPMVLPLLQKKAAARFEPYNGSQVENVSRGGNVSMEPTLRNSLTQAAPAESRAYERSPVPAAALT